MAARDTHPPASDASAASGPRRVPADAAALERALAAEARSRPRRAAARARRAAKRFTTPGDRARMLRAEASALHAAGLHGGAARAYAAAAAAFRRAGLPAEAARTAVGHVDVLVQAGRPRAAVALAARARPVLARARQPVAAAMLDANAAGAHWRMDRPGEARRAYARARAAFARRGHRFGVAACDLNLGNVLASLGRWEEAERAHGAARAAFVELGAAGPAAQADYDLATVLALRDRTSDALALLDRAAEGFRGTGDARHAALVALDRGEIRLRAGLLPEASADLARAVVAARRAGLGVDGARAASLLGLARALEGDRRAAGRHFRAAARAWRRLRHAAGAATTTLHRAAAAAAAGEARGTATRLRALRAAAATFRRRGLRLREAQAHLYAALAGGDSGGARRALRALGGIPAPAVRLAALHVLARAATAAGRRAPAARLWRAALDAAERLRDGVTADDLRVALLRTRAGLFEECAAFLLDGGGPRAPERALEALERGRGRALLDLALAGGDAGVRRTASAAERRLRERLRAAWNRAAGIARDPLRGAPAASALAASERRLARLAGPVTSAPGGAPEEAAALVARVPRGAAAVVYLLRPRDGRALVVRDGGVAVVAGLPGVEEAAERAAAVRHEMGRAAADEGGSERRAARLREDALDAIAAAADAFLAPVLDAAGDGPLHVAPQGPLHGLPFPALAPGRAVSVVPSLRFLGRGRTASAAAAAPLVLGPAVVEGDGTAEEARAVGGTLPGARVLVGAAATRAAFLEEARRAPVVHLAAHGVFRADNPMAGGFALADGWVTARDLLDLRLVADVVVLTACESAAAVAAPGEELLGLPRGFLGAGARCVVAPLWRIPVRGAGALATAFHRSLAAGADAVAALAAAAAEARGRGDHPVLWAAFTVMGAPAAPFARGAAPAPTLAASPSNSTGVAP